MIWKSNSGLRRAVVEVVDSFVLRRVQTLANRAARGKGGERGQRAIDALSSYMDASAPTPEYIETVAKAYERLWDGKRGTILPSKRLRQATIDQFHRIYYHSPKSTWQNTYYRGVTIWKCPLDTWLYQEIIEEVRPDLIIETGTAYGGSAYYMGDLLDNYDNGHVVSIDIQDRTDGLKHPRVTFKIGSSTDPEVKQQAMELLPEGGKVLLILDSGHTYKHVLNEMRMWHDIVTPGSYMIVEDSNISGHPVRTKGGGAGPWEAIDDFLKENNDFDIDESMHKFFLTLNPRGYLKRR